MDGDWRMAQAARQVFALLRIGLAAAPILFGLDRFFNWSARAAYSSQHSALSVPSAAAPKSAVRV